MHRLLNQHSFVIAALLLLGLVLGLMWWRRVRVRYRVGVTGGLAALLVGVMLWLRTGAGDVRTPDDLDRVLGRGRPVVLELYSDY